MCLGSLGQLELTVFHQKQHLPRSLFRQSLSFQSFSRHIFERVNLPSSVPLGAMEWSQVMGPDPSNGFLAFLVRKELNEVLDMFGIGPLCLAWVRPLHQADEAVLTEHLSSPCCYCCCCSSCLYLCCCCGCLLLLWWWWWWLVFWFCCCCCCGGHSPRISAEGCSPRRKSQNSS